MKTCTVDFDNKLTKCKSGFFKTKSWIFHYNTDCQIKNHIHALSKKGFVISFSNLSEHKI